jgi:hypothetical protein
VWKTHDPAKHEPNHTPELARPVASTTAGGCNMSHARLTIVMLSLLASLAMSRGALIELASQVSRKETASDLIFRGRSWKPPSSGVRLKIWQRRTCASLDAILHLLCHPMQRVWLRPHKPADKQDWRSLTLPQIGPASALSRGLLSSSG